MFDISYVNSVDLANFHSVEFDYQVKLIEVLYFPFAVAPCHKPLNSCHSDGSHYSDVNSGDKSFSSPDLLMRQMPHPQKGQ